MHHAYSSGSVENLTPHHLSYAGAADSFQVVYACSIGQLIRTVRASCSIQFNGGPMVSKLMNTSHASVFTPAQVKGRLRVVERRALTGKLVFRWVEGYALNHNLGKHRATNTCAQTFRSPRQKHMQGTVYPVCFASFPGAGQYAAFVLVETRFFMIQLSYADQIPCLV